MTERALSKRQVAEMLGCSVSTVDRLERIGELPPSRRISPGRAAHLESEIVEYLRTRPVGPISDRTAAARAARHPAA